MRRDLGLSKLFVWHTYGTKKVIYTRTTFPHLRCVIMHFVDKYHDGMAETQPDNTHRRDIIVIGAFLWEQTMKRFKS